MARFWKWGQTEAQALDLSEVQKWEDVGMGPCGGLRALMGVYGSTIISSSLGIYATHSQLHG